MSNFLSFSDSELRNLFSVEELSARPDPSFMTVAQDPLGIFTTLRQIFEENLYDANFYILVAELKNFMSKYATTGNAAMDAVVARTSDAMIHYGLLDVLIDIAMEQRWYESDEADVSVVSELLANILEILGGLLRIHQNLRYPGMRPRPVQYAKDKIPELFDLFWQHRHKFLPIPGADTPRWSLRPGYDQRTPDERLEFALVYFITDYASVFAAQPGSPRFTQSSGMLHVHCAARTDQRCDFDMCSKSLSVFLRDIYLNPFNENVWRAALSDPVTAWGLSRQVNMRLRDEDMVDRKLEMVLSLASNTTRFGPRREHDCNKLLHRTARALERQFCTGSMIEEDIRFNDLLSLTLLVLSQLFQPQDSGQIRWDGYQGDISKLDLIGVLAHFSAASVQHESPDDSSLIVDIINRYISIATQYQRDEDGQRKLERLTKRARLSVPLALAATSHVRVPPNALLMRRRKTKLVDAWARYARLLGIPESIPEPEPAEPVPFRTCAYVLCLCSGKKPAHRLRVCQGCWQVYYCGKKCQERDWHAGGHAERCRRFQKAAQRDADDLMQEGEEEA